MKRSTEFDIGSLVIYKNNQLIAFNKPAGLPVQSDLTGDKALLSLAEIYAQSRLWLIHRIDRPASGVVLFARNTRALNHLTTQFQQREVRKTYLAVVGERPDPEENSLRQKLIHLPRINKSVVADPNDPKGKTALLDFRLLRSIDHYHLLEIRLHTGRHHQIRAQLAHLGCPVKGDVKYGFRRKNPDRSIHLHAWKLEFRHPVSNEWEQVVAPVPEETVWQAFGNLD